MTTTFLKHFDSIADTRIERYKKHNLLDIFLLAISAILSGAEGWAEIEYFGHLKLDWLQLYRNFEVGIPRHDTIARVICRLKADEVEHAFQSLISSLVKATGCDVITIDGKTARRSFTTKDRKNGLHTVSTLSCQHQLVLRQTAVSEKSNAITAIPVLLTMLDIENCILALKDNHYGMKAELAA
jgi:predicted transposase YbfD/YdcC